MNFKKYSAKLSDGSAARARPHQPPARSRLARRRSRLRLYSVSVPEGSPSVVSAACLGLTRIEGQRILQAKEVYAHNTRAALRLPVALLFGRRTSAPHQGIWGAGRGTRRTVRYLKFSTRHNLCGRPHKSWRVSGKGAGPLACGEAPIEQNGGAAMARGPTSLRLGSAEACIT